MTIELTSEQVYMLFHQIQFEWDRDYILTSLYEQYEDGDDAETVDIERLRNDPEFCDRVTKRYRKYLDDTYGSYREWECLKDAVRYIKRAEKDERSKLNE